MELYLFRHGEAMSPLEDPERPLTPRGNQDVEQMVKHLKKKHVRFEKLYHSPKKRAVETASILGNAFSISPESKDFLTPNDDPEVAKCLLQEDQNIMIVGHLPHLPSLASLLMSGTIGKIQLDMKTASAVCLEKGRIWSLRWILRPESD